MGMMTGSGPLSRHPTGRFNFEAPEPGQALYLEPSPKRVRVLVGGETIVDSCHAMLLQESGLMALYYFPPGDVRTDLLEPSDKHTRCPKKGEASYYNLRLGQRLIEDAAWYYPDPIEGAPPLKDLVAFYWDRVDQWFEEDEELFGHARDPYHRIDVRPSSRHIRISRDGELLAETHRPMALFESNLPVRWYIPREDVVAEITASETTSVCPYKGQAQYYSVAGHEDLIWFYSEPLPEASPIAGLLCFYNEKVDLEVDGELQERPPPLGR